MLIQVLYNLTQTLEGARLFIQTGGLAPLLVPRLSDSDPSSGLVTAYLKLVDHLTQDQHILLHTFEDSIRDSLQTEQPLESLLHALSIESSLNLPIFKQALINVSIITFTHGNYYIKLNPLRLAAPTSHSPVIGALCDAFSEVFTVERSSEVLVLNCERITALLADLLQSYPPLLFTVLNH